MVHKLHSPLANHRRVLFELPSSLWADRVFVVGNFKQGAQVRTPLTQARDGVWRATLDLPVGRQYQFHYLVNGAWTADFHADGFVPGEGRVSDSVLDIS